VVLHEVGHVLGLRDAVGTGGLMDYTVPAGVRRPVPAWDAAQPVPTASVDGVAGAAPATSRSCTTG